MCSKHDETVMFCDFLSHHTSPAAVHDLVEESRAVMVEREEQMMHATNEDVVDDEWDVAFCVFTCGTSSGGKSGGG